MSTAAVIEGVYSDLKTIKSRSTVQIIIECPIERGREIVDAFGFPQPGGEVHVAIARLAPGSATAPAAKPKEVRRFNDMPVAQQSALACQDAVFRAFIREHMGGVAGNPEDTAHWIRAFFTVGSRRDINPDEWADLWGRFLAWKAAERAA